MNTNEIKLQLDKSHSEYEWTSDIVYVTLPLFRLSQRLLSQINNLLNEKYSMSNTELDILTSLYLHGEKAYTLTPTQLYERLFFSSGGMTKVLKKLEKKEFIQRLDNEEDKRSELVQLTPIGQDILEKAIVDVIALEEKVFTDVNSNERKRLSDLLFKSLESYEKQSR